MTFRVTRYQVTNQCPVWRAAGGKPLPERSERTRGRSAMARKALRVLLPASVAVLVASQWREIAPPPEISHKFPRRRPPPTGPARGQHAHQRTGAARGAARLDAGVVAVRGARGPGRVVALRAGVGATGGLGAGGGARAPPVLAGQPAPAERAPRQHPQARVEACGYDLPLGLPRQQAVLR